MRGNRSDEDITTPKRRPGDGSAYSGPAYEVHYSPRSLEDLEQLPTETRRRIILKIAATKNDPFHFFERLVGRTDYRLRVGKHRVIADITEKTIAITLIGPRDKVYER